jgi:hypothetical protein
VTFAFQRALIALGLVIRAHPIFFLTGVIMGVVAAMSSLRNQTEENLKAAEAQTANVADAANLYDAYISKVYSAGGALDEETRALRENTIAAIENARAKLGQTEFEVRSGTSIQGTGRNGLKIAPYTSINGVQTGGNAAEVVAALTRDGRYVPAQNAEEFKRRIRIGGQFEQMKGLNPDQYKGYESLHRALTADINTAITQSRVQGGAARLGYDAAKIAGQTYGDYNKETPLGGGISGDPVEKPDKSGASAAAAEARQYEQDIRRATEALRDLRRETAASTAEITAYLSGSDNLILDQAARAEAEMKVNNFMDSFKNAAQAEKGIVDLNQRMQQQTDILESLSPAAKKAREELITFLTAQERANMEAKAGAALARNIDDMKRENDLQEQLVDATARGGRELQKQTMELEIQKQLRGVAPEDAGRLEAALRGQLTRQQEINRALEYAKILNETQLESRNMRDTAKLYQGGYRQEEIEYYKELIEYRNKLINDGLENKQINDQVRLRAALLNQKSAYGELTKEYEKNRQVAQDMADAIVDGFRDGIESGQSFLKTIKNIFADLKSIILQFVLYDPLRKWLTDVFTVNAPGAAAQPQIASRGLAIENLGSNVLGSIFGSPSGGGSSGLANIRGMGGPYNGIVEGDSTLPAQTGVGGTWQSINSSIDGLGTIFVDGQREQQVVLEQIPQKLGGPQYFNKLKQIFDWKQNGKAIGDLFKGPMKDLGSKIGPALQAVGKAYAAYELGNTIGKSVGKALGLGERGQNVAGGILGGAAAGYSVGGPLGAAIGATIGGIIGFLKKKTKLPSSWGSVVVGEDGVAGVGTAGRYGKGSLEAGREAGRGGANLFNQFAIMFDATLRAGNYGAFGRRKFTKKGEEEAFYSLSGSTRKGKPIGKEGIDWIRGTDSQVQAFALIQQVRRGMINDLDPTTRTIFQSTQAKDMEALNADLEIGKAYDAFIKGSFILPDVRRQVEDLNEAHRKLSKQARLLGLSEGKLTEARNRLLESMKDEFNFSIDQQVLEISNPAAAAYNQLVKEYRDTVDEAMAVGGNLAEVERLFGMRRAQILEETTGSAFDTIRQQAKDLLTALTATQDSPLAGGTIFRNARDMFTGLQGQLARGDMSNAENLSSYAQNYLSSAYEQFGSSTEYFDIFRAVTDFLADMGDYSGAPGAGGGTDWEMPELPALQTLVDEINARNEELLAATGEIGTAQLEELQNISGLLETALGVTGGLRSPLFDRANTLATAGTGTTSTSSSNA